jgi:hypothetical protein
MLKISVAPPITTSLAVCQCKMLFHRVFLNESMIIGVLLAADVYRPKYSATSPYIVGTIRNNEKFLWICAGIWAVRFFLTFECSQRM